MERPNLDLNLLVLLNLVLRERNVGLAARRLNLSQPAVSNSLARLRSYYGDDLLVRRGTQMVLTSFGEALRGELDSFVVKAAQLSNVRPRFDPSVSRREIALLASDYIVASFGNLLLREVAQQAPQIRLSFLPLGLDAPVRFNAGEADFMISPVPARHPCQTFAREHLMGVACAGNTRLHGVLDREAYAALPHIVPALGRHLENKLLWLGPRGRVAASAPMTVLAALLAGTDCVAVLPESLARAAHAAHAVKLLELPAPGAEIAEMIYWRKESQEDPASLWFRQLLSVLPLTQG